MEVDNRERCGHGQALRMRRRERLNLPRCANLCGRDLTSQLGIPRPTWRSRTSPDRDVNEEETWHEAGPAIS
eukprot:763548-Hanusia_phi.AAC.1